VYAAGFALFASVILFDWPTRATINMSSSRVSPTINSRTKVLSSNSVCVKGSLNISSLSYVTFIAGTWPPPAARPVHINDVVLIVGNVMPVVCHVNDVPLTQNRSSLPDTDIPKRHRALVPARSSVTLKNLRENSDISIIEPPATIPIRIAPLLFNWR